MLRSTRDQLPEFVARMGQLTMDSPVRECLELRKEWKSAMFDLERDGSAEDIAARCRAGDKLINKVIASPEFRNYCEVTRDLFGRKEIKRLHERLIEESCRCNSITIGED